MSERNTKLFDEGLTLEMLDFTIRIGSTRVHQPFCVYRCVATVAHCHESNFSVWMDWPSSIELWRNRSDRQPRGTSECLRKKARRASRFCIRKLSCKSHSWEKKTDWKRAFDRLCTENYHHWEDQGTVFSARTRELELVSNNMNEVLVHANNNTNVKAIGIALVTNFARICFVLVKKK